MSLFNLLAVSRSFIGLKSQNGRYSMRSSGGLPQFNQNRRPEFMSSAMPGSGERASVTLFDYSYSAGEGEEVNQAGKDKPSKFSAPDFEQSSATGGDWQRKEKAISMENKTGFVNATTTPLSILRALFGRKATPEVQPLVQSELKLDGVKVVRNELFDSDLELVPVRAKREMESSAARFAKPEPARSKGLVWCRLTAQRLRQAVQDFNLLQTQRANIFAQTSDAEGSDGISSAEIRRDLR
jgi:hypothetical protein